MKQKVRMSWWCKSITTVVIVALLIGLVSSWDEPDKMITLAVVLAGMVGFSLYYYPRSIATGASGLIIHRQLCDKVIPYADIASAERCYPSAGGLRICGSGGFFGYWGYFTDIAFGCYFGYYGDRNQCILVKLHDGKQYVISCENPDEMLLDLTRRL